MPPNSLATMRSNMTLLLFFFLDVRLNVALMPLGRPANVAPNLDAMFPSSTPNLCLQRETKVMDAAKGMIYLPGCNVKLEEAEQRLYFRASGGKVYYLAVHDPEQGHMTESANIKLKSWMNAINWALTAANGLEDVKIVENDWMWKRGGKSHGYVNWKKRRFMLRGNLLLYYGEDPKAWDVFEGLNGFIDLASITFIDGREDPAAGIDKKHWFKLIVDNEREFFIAAPTEEQKKAWIRAIKKQSKALADRLHYSNLRSLNLTETVIRKYTIMRLNRIREPQNVFIVITNLKLRYYDAESDFTENNFGSRQLGSIPLLGLAIKHSEDRVTLRLHDLQGHTFSFFTTEPALCDKIIKHLQTASQSLLNNLIFDRKGSMSLNTYATDSKGQDLGYTIVQLDADAVTFISLLYNRRKRIEHAAIKQTRLVEREFSLTYASKQDAKKIVFKSVNAIAFYEAISGVMDQWTALHAPSSTDAKKADKPSKESAKEAPKEAAGPKVAPKSKSGGIEYKASNKESKTVEKATKTTAEAKPAQKEAKTAEAPAAEPSPATKPKNKKDDAPGDASNKVEPTAEPAETKAKKKEAKHEDPEPSPAASKSSSSKKSSIPTSEPKDAPAASESAEPTVTEKKPRKKEPKTEEPEPTPSPSKNSSSKNASSTTSESKDATTATEGTEPAAKEKKPRKKQKA